MHLDLSAHSKYKDKVADVEHKSEARKAPSDQCGILLDTKLGVSN